MVTLPDRPLFSPGAAEVEEAPAEVTTTSNTSAAPTPSDQLAAMRAPYLLRRKPTLVQAPVQAVPRGDGQKGVEFKRVLPSQSYPRIPQPNADGTGMQLGAMPLPRNQMAPWRPDGKKGYWPRDEYIITGGDEQPEVKVNYATWEISGLLPGESGVHSDTKNEQIMFQKTNPVAIYAPRFAGVRIITSAQSDRQYNALEDMRKYDAPLAPQETLVATTKQQNTQVVNQTGRKVLQSDLAVAAPFASQKTDSLLELAKEELPYAKLSHLAPAGTQADLGPELAAGVLAAKSYFNDVVAQVVLDGRNAMEGKTYEKVDGYYVVNMPPDKFELSLIKTASTASAKPGDIVEFTFYFENVGTRELQTVTLVDNLTTRLRYIKGSGKSSVPGTFFLTEANETGSTCVRAELSRGLKVGAKGVIKFKCELW